MRPAILTAAVVFAVAQSAWASAPKDAWKVTRVKDPITGASSCVVTAADQVSSFAFTRSGYLYPIAENNSQFGLLVGVSTGGQIRLPSGDILWKVDDKPFRELKAADNPVGNSTAATFPLPAGATPELKSAMETSARAIAGLTATSTVASGDKAREILAEMYAGKSLLFRAANAAPAYGLPSSATNRVGQITSDGQRPISIDQSFRSGLSQCGIAPDGTLSK